MGTRHYSKVLREQIISEVQGGRSVAAVARDYEPCAQTIHRWLASVGDEQSTVGETDKAALLAENVRLRRDLVILKKAAAWFARENLEGQ